MSHDEVCDKGHKFNRAEHSHCPHCTAMDPKRHGAWKVAEAVKGNQGVRHTAIDPARKGASSSDSAEQGRHGTAIDPKRNDASSDNAERVGRGTAQDPKRKPDPAPATSKTRLVKNTNPAEPALPPIRGWLVMTGGQHAGQDYPLRLGRNLVGANKICDVVIPEAAGGIERVHAVIRLVDGGGQLTDCDTGGKTILAGEEVVRAELSSGATLQLGQVELAFRCFEREFA